MKISITDLDDIVECTEEILKRVPRQKLSYFEAMQIALELEKNRLLDRKNSLFSTAFALDSAAIHPTALETIAMALGCDGGKIHRIGESLFEIAAAISDVANAMERN